MQAVAIISVVVTVVTAIAAAAAAAAAAVTVMAEYPPQPSGEQCWIVEAPTATTRPLPPLYVIVIRLVMCIVESPRLLLESMAVATAVTVLVVVVIAVMPPLVAVAVAVAVTPSLPRSRRAQGMCTL